MLITVPTKTHSATAPQFSIAPVYKVKTLNPGETTYFGFHLSSDTGYGALIDITYDADIEKIGIAKRSLRAGDTTWVKVETKADQLAGNYPITIFATSRGVTEQATVNLIIESEQSQTLEYFQPESQHFGEYAHMSSNLWVDNHQSVTKATITVYYTDSFIDTHSPYLVSPAGTRIAGATYYGTGEWEDQSFTLEFDNFSGEPAAGNWRLYLDTSIYETGWFSGWSLKLDVDGGYVTSAPFANFEIKILQDLLVSFIDVSRDPDDDIVSWYWEFGDGTASTEQNPQHQYAEDGYYNVTLTVFDSEGRKNSTDVESIAVELPEIILWQQSARPFENGFKVRLVWQGSYQDTVDIYRNEVKIATTENDGSYDETVPEATEPEYRYQVCDALPVCSNIHTFTVK